MAPDVKKANTTDNAEAIIKIINDAKIENISLLLLPELVLTGANLGNLFNQKQLLKSASKMLFFEIIQSTENTGITLVLGGYEKTKNNLYKTNYIIQNGELLHTHETLIFQKMKCQLLLILMKMRKQFT